MLTLDLLFYVKHLELPWGWKHLDKWTWFASTKAEKQKCFCTHRCLGSSKCLCMSACKRQQKFFYILFFMSLTLKMSSGGSKTLKLITFFFWLTFLARIPLTVYSARDIKQWYLHFLSQNYISIASTYRASNNITIIDQVEFLAVVPRDLLLGTVCLLK